MNCAKCNTPMKQQVGKYGKFLFCPNQSKCKCKTITLGDGMDAMYRSQRVAKKQRYEATRSEQDKKADFFWEGERMMDDIECEELGGGHK